MKSPMSRSINWMGATILFYGTLVAAVVAFVVYPYQHLVATTIDLNGHGALARNLAQGHGFSFGFGPSIRRAPLYPFLGAGLMKTFGSGSLYLRDAIAYRPILAANCLIFGLTCFMVWVVARRLFGPRVALLAALLCPLVPQAIRYVGMTEVETLMGLWVVLLAYTGLNLVERPGPWTGAWFGLTAAAATLTKPVTEYYPVVFIALAWWYWCAEGPGSVRALLSRPRIAATLAALACFCAALVPWTLRNAAVTNGQFVGISSDGSGAFLRGYINTQPKYFLLRGTLGTWESDANSYEEQYLRKYGFPFYRYSFDPYGRAVVVPHIPKGVTGAQLEARQDRLEGPEVTRRILHEPAAFLHKFVIQLATFWYLAESRLTSLAVGAIALVVLILASMGVRRARRDRVHTWPVVAIVLYLNVIYAVSLALDRYSAPLFPVLLVLSAGGLASLFPQYFSPAVIRPDTSSTFAIDEPVLESV